VFPGVDLTVGLTLKFLLTEAKRGDARAEVGLRERRSGRARQHTADAAARLFAERGSEHVAVLDVAEAAEVSEQTV
jgi:AcrR family transcriptional regulator